MNRVSCFTKLKLARALSFNDRNIKVIENMSQFETKEDFCRTCINAGAKVIKGHLKLSGNALLVYDNQLPTDEKPNTIIEYGSAVQYGKPKYCYIYRL